MAKGANAILEQLYLEHQVLLERLKAGETREILGLINGDLLPAVRARLMARLVRIKSRGYDSGPWSTQALRDLERGLKELYAVGFAKIHAVQEANLFGFSKYEATWARAAFAEVLPAGFSLARPTAASLRAVVNAQPMEGALLKDWFAELGRRAQRETMRQIRIGISLGESVPHMAARVEGPARLARGHAETLVRTSFQYVSSHARQEVFAANADIIAREVWTATLDDRTSQTCIGLDGTTYAVGEGPMPPAHLRCRSWRRPELKSAAELGIPLNDFDVTGLDGEPVGTTSYKDWLMGQSAAKQAEILGVGKAKLFQADPSILSKFVGADLKPVTLAELLAG